MSFDLQYLLFLQNLRGATGGIFNEFFNAISKFAVDMLKFLPYVILWCVSTKWGYRFIATIWGGEVVNGVVKLSVCAYRPWIRSDLIEPAGDSKTAATGYSFPSGHTMCATTMYGTTFVWQKNKRRWLAVLCAVMIALTGFSRNFLGVHTPQDVIVSFLESCLLIFVIGLIQNHIDGNDKLKDILSIVGVAGVILVLVYIMFKPSPMDYVAGVPLVDPPKMMNDLFKGCGGFLGFLIGAYIDRHYIHYEIPKGHENLAILSCIGMGLMFSWKEWFGPATIVAALGPHWGNLLSALILTVFGITAWPLVIRKYCSEKAAQTAKAEAD